MEITIWVIIIIAVAIGSYFLGFLCEKYLRFKLNKKIKLKIKQTEEKAKKIINVAKADGKVEAAQIRQEMINELARKREEFLETEKFLTNRERLIIEREEVLNNKEQETFRKKEELQGKINYYQEIVERNLKQLEKVAGYSPDQAKDMLFKEISDRYQKEIGEFLRNAENTAKINAKETAITIITSAIERYAANIVIEKTVASVYLEDDNMKGRIIGKDGRNIRTFEVAAGVDLIIDDTPNVVQISSFNPIRREIAKKTLEKLLIDGRIQPNRIEEAIKLEQEEIEVTILETGKEVVAELQLDNINIELIRYLGILKYRTSYGQNVLLHSIEVAKLAAIMASELGLDSALAMRAGLLHDIGKAVDFETEGSHVTLGVKLATRCEENPIVINAIASHHGEVLADNPYSVLISAADTLSAARPGSRNNNLENYIARMSELEKICQTVTGVQSVYVLQAGRQIRVIVNPIISDDDCTHKIALDIKEKIKKTKAIPGDIVITVIRELRVTETVI
ncbi:ribonuclease Y [Spiroplasma endosymbiont of Stenodema calcarata]|uniref:ribonuclease Y n=1 Tax=Spiroplasma endosymbiont of Stenodema calcarata TaxID=3139328 RepID=UPI003CCB64A0